jgi:hypothetical protein
MERVMDPVKMLLNEADCIVSLNLLNNLPERSSLKKVNKARQPTPDEIEQAKIDYWRRHGQSNNSGI